MGPLVCSCCSPWAQSGKTKHPALECLLQVTSGKAKALLHLLPLAHKRVPKEKTLKMEKNARKEIYYYSAWMLKCGIVNEVLASYAHPKKKMILRLNVFLSLTKTYIN